MRASCGRQEDGTNEARHGGVVDRNLPGHASHSGPCEGYEVYIVTDASGGVSPEAHDMAVRRMVQAGAVPMTWLAVQGEWQRDWAREATAAHLAEVLSQHGGASGVAFAWEVQLLTSRANVGA